MGIVAEAPNGTMKQAADRRWILGPLRQAVESQSSEDRAKGNLAVPGGPLTSKPTWSNPSSGCSTTSAFFCAFGGARQSKPGVTEGFHEYVNDFPQGANPAPSWEGDGGGVCPDARRLSGGVCDRRECAGPHAVRGGLLPPDGRHHRRVSPLLLSPLVQDQSGVPVRVGLAGVQCLAAWADLVGGAAPAPPPHIGHPGRPALARRPQPLAVPHRLGLLAGIRAARTSRR